MPLNRLIALALLACSFSTAQSSLTITQADHMQRAVEYLKRNDAASAERELNAVLALNPRNAAALADLGAIAFARGDCAAATPRLQQALAEDPSLVRSEGLLGVCESKSGNPAAQHMLQAAFSNLQEKTLKIRVGLELMELEYRNANLTEAASTARSLVELAPDNVEVLNMAQRVYAESADDTVNKIALLAPGSAQMQQVIAERLINQGDLQSAIVHYRKALATSPSLPGAHYELAEAILESAPNDPQTQIEADKELRTALSTDGDSAGVECMFARIAARRSDPESAFAHYQRALEFNSANSEAQIGVGRYYAQKDLPLKAVDHLRKAVALDPMNEQAHYWLATVCKRLSLDSESSKEYKLFDEIKDAKGRLRDLYQQMNLHPPDQFGAEKSNQQNN